jgi:hypothetical protein
MRDLTKIQWALDLLNDGRWHSIDALRNNIDFSDFEITELVTFLTDYDFAALDPEGLKVRINSDFRRLITKKS